MSRGVWSQTMWVNRHALKAISVCHKYWKRLCYSRVIVKIFQGDRLVMYEDNNHGDEPVSWLINCIYEPQVSLKKSPLCRKIGRPATAVTSENFCKHVSSRTSRGRISYNHKVQELLSYWVWNEYEAQVCLHLYPAMTRVRSVLYAASANPGSLIWGWQTSDPVPLLS